MDSVEQKKKEELYIKEKESRELELDSREKEVEKLLKKILEMELEHKHEMKAAALAADTQLKEATSEAASDTEAKHRKAIAFMEESFKTRLGEAEAKSAKAAAAKFAVERRALQQAI